jgi:hypothetical protein
MSSAPRCASGTRCPTMLTCSLGFLVVAASPVWVPCLPSPCAYSLSSQSAWCWRDVCGPPTAAAYRKALEGVTWQGALPNLTLTFTADTVRIYDGCVNDLYATSVDAAELDVGKPIEKLTVCGGTPGGPSPAVRHFAAVAFSKHMSWRRTGDTLQLTNTPGVTLRLHANGPALEITVRPWVLQRFTDASGYDQEGDFHTATLSINGSGGDLPNPFWQPDLFDPRQRADRLRRTPRPAGVHTRQLGFPP